MTGKYTNKAKYLILIPIALTIIVYAYSLTFELINLDDHHLVRELSAIQNFEQIVDKAFNSQYLSGGYFRPLVTITVWLDLQIVSGSYFFLHLTNVILHIISVIIIYVLFRDLFLSYKIALVSACLFALHPIFVNAIAWILGRNDLLVGMFILLSFLYFIKYINNAKIIYFILHIASFFLALLSKETGVVFPVVCVLYVYLYNRQKLFSLRSVLMIIGWAAVVLLWYFLRNNAIGSIDKEIIAFEYFFSNIRIIPEFIGKFFLPADITVLPAFRLFNTWFGIIAMVGLLISPFLLKNINTKLFILGLVWFFIFTVPGMFSLIFTDNDFFSYFDCRAYLPMAGLSISFISLLPQRIFNFKNKRYCLAIIIILLSLATVSIMEARYYRSPLKYWTKAVREEPKKARYWFELGVNAGKAGQYESAEKFILKATELNPGRPEFYLSLGEMMNKIGSYAKAEDYLLKSIERYPEWLPPQVKLTEVLYKQGKYHNAINIIELTFSKVQVVSDLIPNLIRSHINIKQYSMAIKKLNKYADHLSKEATSDLFVYIGASAIAENEEIAVKSWKRALDFNNNNEDAIKNLYQYYSLIGKAEAVRYKEMMNRISNK